MGLLPPVVVTPDNRLIAGKRRLEACKTLGWAEIAVNIVPLQEIARGEFAENMVRAGTLGQVFDTPVLGEGCLVATHHPASNSAGA